MKEAEKNIHDPHRYDDMLNLPHHQSTRHPQMSLYNRAAQFSPFAALTGYEDTISETARLTDQKVELDENAKTILDTKFLMIMEHLQEHQELQFTYFIPDPRKAGGIYHTEFGVVKKINLKDRKLVLFPRNPATATGMNGSVIDIDQIIDIQGRLFQGLEEASY